MKIKVLALALLSALGAKAQLQPTGYIPQDANIVYSINLPNILQKISVETLEEYKMFQDMAKEISRGKTTKISDFGIDQASSFNQFMSFTEKGLRTGFNIAIKDIEEFFRLVDGNSEEMIQDLTTKGFHIDYNTILVYNNGVLTFMYIELINPKVRDYCDSIYDANGWNKGYYYDPYEYNSYETEAVEEAVEMEVEEVYEEPENDAEYYAVPPPPVMEETEEVYVEEVIEEPHPVVPTHPNYYDFKDSVREAWHLAELLSLHDKIKKGSPFSAEVLQKMDNGKDANFYMLQSFPVNAKFNKYLAREIGLPREFVNQIMEMNQGQEFFMDVNFTENGYEISSEVKYAGLMAEVVDLIEFEKVDKKLLNYIPGNSVGYAILNNGGKETYEKIKSELIPRLEQEGNEAEKSMAYLWYALDNFMDMDAFYDAFPGELVFSYNGFTSQKVKTMSYEYDENFNAVATETEHYQMLPAFSLALHSEDPTFLRKTLEYLTNTFGDYISKVDNYYMIQTPGAPAVYISIEGEFILASNDIAYVTTYAKGYGKDGLAKAEKKSLKKVKGIYANFDYQAFAQGIPADLMGERAHAEMMQYTPYFGKMTLSQDFVKGKGTAKLTYEMQSEAPNGIYGALNLINLFYTNTAR